MDKMITPFVESEAFESDFVSLWNLSELVRWQDLGLLPVRQNMDIEFYCSFLGAYESATFFKDIPTLVHGPAGCTESFNATRAYPGKTKENKPVSLSTALNHDDVVFGASKKLQEAIVKLDKTAHPKLVTILTNCCADIIGEDINGAINTVSEQIDADVINIETGGCSGYGFRKGADMVFGRLFEYVAEKYPRKHDVDTPSVNVFTKRLSGRPAELAEMDELERLLGKVGVKVNSIIRLGSRYDDLARIPQATANASLCHVFGDEPMRMLEKILGQRFTRTAYPIGLDGTVTWIREIADVTGMDGHVLEHDDEIESYRKKVEHAKSKYEGRKAFIWMPGEKGLAMARFMVELGIQPYLFTMSYLAVKELRESMKIFLDAGYDFPAVLTGKQLIMKACQENMKPDEMPILFMPRKFWTGELPTATVNFYSDPMLGLQGIDFLIESMDKAMKNAGKKDYALFNRYVEDRYVAQKWNLDGKPFDGVEKYLDKKKVRSV